MIKSIPYCAYDVVHDIQGDIQSIKITALVYLPIDSVVQKIGEGPVADSVDERLLTVAYQGVDLKCKIFEVEFVIARGDIGLLETGAQVQVVDSSQPTGNLLRASKKGSVAIKYKDVLV